MDLCLVGYGNFRLCAEFGSTDNADENRKYVKTNLFTQKNYIYITC